MPIRNADRFYPRAFAIATALLLGALLWQVVLPFLRPLFWAALLAFLLHPLQTWLTHHWRGRHSAAAALLTVGIALLLLGPLTALSAAFVAQANDLIGWVQGALDAKPNQQYRTLAALPMMDPLLRWMTDTLGIPPSQVKEWLAHVAEAAPEFLTGLGGRLFLGAINTALALVVMLFALFFLVRDGGAVVALLERMIPMAAARRDLLLAHMAAVTRAVVFGTGVTVLVQGALVGCGFLITGFETPLVFGALAAITALLPFGGTAFVWVPATLVLAGQDRWGMALVMLAIGMIASTIDNVLRPLLISSQAEVGTLAVFVGVLGGAAAFGAIGAVVGPLVIALTLALLQFHLEPPAAAAK